MSYLNLHLSLQPCLFVYPYFVSALHWGRVTPLKKKSVVCSISDLLGSSSQSPTRRRVSLVGLEALSLDHDVVQAAAGGGCGRDGVVVVAGDGGGGHHLLKNVTPNCRIDTS